MATEKYTPKEDSVPVLYEGMGTPYLAIFNGQSKPIICPKHKLPIGVFVKGFEYKYVEKGPDTGEIQIETDNADLLDHQDLQYYSELWLQWGYIFPDTSFLPGPARKVVIIGMSMQFTENGTTINIKFADVGILLKTVPSNYYNNLEGFEDFIKDLLRGDFVGDVELIDYAEIDSKPILVVSEGVSDQTSRGSEEVPYAKEQARNYGSGRNYGKEKGNYTVYDSIQEPHQVVPDQDGTILIKLDAKTGALTNSLPDIYETKWVKKQEVRTLTVTGFSKNKYQQIEEWVGQIDNGPFTMDMRDGRLKIHNRATQRPPYKTYTYAGGNGELLQFSIDCEYVTTSVEVSKSVDLDPLDKSLNTTLVQGISNPTIGNIDGYLTGVNPTPPTHQADNSYVKGFPMPKDTIQYVNLDGSSSMPSSEFTGVTPTKVKAIDEFPNIEAAKTYITNHLSDYITEQDIKNWFSSFKSDFDTWVKSDNIGESIKNLQEISNYILKLKVKLQRKEIPDMVAAGIYLLMSEKSTEELANQLQTGELDLSTITYGTVNGRPGVDQRYSSYGTWTLNGNKYTASQAVAKVQEVVTQASGTVTYSKEINPTGDLLNPKYIKGSATYEVELELPIPGTRLLGDPRFKGAASSMTSDIEETVTNQMTATGIFIGDPILESSFNINIQGISKRYSGTWYTKEVVHKISPEGGYKCEATFVQRAVPVSTRIIESNWAHSDFAKEIFEAAKHELDTKEGETKKTSTTQMLKTKFKEGTQSLAYVQKNGGSHIKASSDIISSVGYREATEEERKPKNLKM